MNLQGFSGEKVPKGGRNGRKQAVKGKKSNFFELEIIFFEKKSKKVRKSI